MERKKQRKRLSVLFAGAKYRWQGRAHLPSSDSIYAYAHHLINRMNLDPVLKRKIKASAVQRVRVEVARIIGEKRNLLPVALAYRVFSRAERELHEYLAIPEKERAPFDGLAPSQVLHGLQVAIRRLKELRTEDPLMFIRYNVGSIETLSVINFALINSRLDVRRRKAFDKRMLLAQHLNESIFGED